MTELAPPAEQREVDLRKINNLTERYGEKLGAFEVFPVGNAGFLLQSERQKPMAGNDWFLFDYDDTLRATTEVKDKRLDLYKKYLLETDLDLPEESISKLMDVTDKFSRWEDAEGGGDSYHANTHLSALHWATEKVRKKPVGEREQSVGDVEKSLRRIKEELSTNAEPEENDPFLFRNKKLVLRSRFWYPEGELNPWSKQLGEIFMKSMINPPDYSETIEALKKIGQPAESDSRLNIGIFTYGMPYYQLLKVLELMEQAPDLPISQIWLTQVPKGKFIKELAESGVTSKTKMDYRKPVPGGDRIGVGDSFDEDYGGGLSMSSGQVLGDTPHTIVMLDDSPKELSSILSVNEYLAEKTGASFVTVRSRRSGTKEGEKEWVVQGPSGEVDFRSREFTAEEIALALRINRFLNYRVKYGEDNEKVFELRSELISEGVPEEELIAS